MKYRIKGIIWILIWSTVLPAYSQLDPGVYGAMEQKDGKTIQHQITMSEDYLIHTVYEDTPSKFISTAGGFFKISDTEIEISLEFNSNYAEDGLRTKTLAYNITGSLINIGNPLLEYKKVDHNDQALDGHWLFATRGPDEGQERRGDDRPRKTLKVLQDGTFQWIAYNTESFEFFGTGGGSYVTENGIYTESIEFFSRDNSRVGAQLQFNYELKGADWHHTGKNSRGEPMYEIWSRR